VKGESESESAKMRVYLDNCSLNRPFDNQKQLRIRLETEAKLAIQENIHIGAIQLAWSYMLDFENSANPFVERRETILGWKKKASVDVEETSNILNLAKEIQHLGFKSKDCLHVACAIFAKCDYFISTDDGIVKRRNDVQKIKIRNPLDFVKAELYED
jgi:hypothetical protein